MFTGKYEQPVTLLFAVSAAQYFLASIRYATLRVQTVALYSNGYTQFTSANPSFTSFVWTEAKLTCILDRL